MPQASYKMIKLLNNKKYRIKVIYQVKKIITI